MNRPSSPLIRLVCFFALLFALAAPSARADDLAMDAFGVCANPQSYTNHEEFCDHLIASGVKWVRISPEWGAIETAKGVYDAAYLARLDAIVNRLHASDVKILWILCYTAPWASSQPALGWPDATRHKPAAWSDWENYVTFITTRYSGKVMHWEVWNEPDHFGFWKDSVADYAELLKRAYPKIKAANAANTVLLGGLAMTNGTTDYDHYGLGTFFDTLLDISGVAAAFDVVNYHAYGGIRRHAAMRAGMLAVTTKHGISARPLWITETGYTTVGDTTKEATKADHLDQTWLLTTRSADITRSFFYTHRNPVITPANPSEENFGLCANDLTPLRAFYHFQGFGGAPVSATLQRLHPGVASATRALYAVAPASGDGSHTVACHAIPATRFAYYRVNDSWMFNVNETTSVDVTYLDVGTGSFSIQYDASANAYQSLAHTRTNTGAWLTHTFTLTGSKFANRQNNLTDFRLSAGSAELAVSSVVLRRASDSSNRELAPFPAGAGDGSHVVAQNRIAAGSYLYLRANDTWLNDTNQGLDETVHLDLTYLDTGTGSFSLQYDAVANAYQSLSQARANTGAWVTRTFTLADTKLANRQNHLADLRLASGATDLVVKSIVLYRSLNPAVAVLKSAPALKLFTYKPATDPTHIGYNPIATQGGVECRSITANNRYVFLDVADGLVASTDTNVTVTITFWDAGTDNLALTYNAIGNLHKGVTITKTNTLQWRTVAVPLTDARFVNGQSYYADFNIGNAGDGSSEYIRRVEVTAN